MLPSRIQIKNEVYEIVYQRIIDNPNDLGYCDDKKRILYIKLGLDELTELDTAIHEVLHALTYLHKIRISHSNLTKLATALAVLILDNGYSLQSDDNK
jgi:hypothetical protein